MKMAEMFSLKVFLFTAIKFSLFKYSHLAVVA